MRKMIDVTYHRPLTSALCELSLFFLLSRIEIYSHLIKTSFNMNKVGRTKTTKQGAKAKIIYLYKD